MNLTTKITPDLQTVFGIQFFRKNQTKPTQGLIGTEWIKIPQNSELPFIYHHLRKGVQLSVAKTHSSPMNGRVSLFFRNFFIGEINGGFSNTVADSLTAGIQILARISEVEKETFMPIKNIKVEFLKA